MFQTVQAREMLLSPENLRETLVSEVPTFSDVEQHVIEAFQDSKD